MTWLSRLGRQRQSLTTTFVIGVLCVLLPVAVLLGLLGQQRRERDRQAAIDSLTQMAESIALIADHTLDDGVKLTQTIATAPPIRTLDPAVFLPRLREIQAIHEQYSTLSIVDPNGVMLGSVGDGTPSTTLSPAQRETLDRVVRSRTLTLFVTPDPDDAALLDGGAMAPMVRDDGTVMGVVVAMFDVRKLAERLRDLRTSPDQGLALLDNTGRLVLTLVPSTGVLAEGLTWEQRARGTAPEVQRALRGEIAVNPSFISPVLEDERLGVWVPTREHGWVASASWPVAAALAPSRLAERDELLIFATIVVVMVIGAVLAARLGVRPLQRLAAHADRFGEGDFQPILGPDSNDEIGRLTGAFNRMGQRLQQTLGDLQAERSRLESVLEQLPIGVVVVAADDYAVVRSNTLADRFLAHTAMRARQYDPADRSYAFHLDGRPYLSEERPLGRALRDGETVRAEELLLRVPGQPEIVLNVNAAPIRDGAGRIVAAVQTIEDVTAQRLAAVRLHRQDELLRTLFEQFPGTLAVIDRDFRFLMAASPGPYEYTSPDQVIGRTFDEVLPAGAAEATKQRLLRAFAGATIADEDVSGGRVFSTIACPLREADGTISRVLTLRFDVTEQRRTAERLREREILLQALIDQFPAAISVTDRQHRIVMIGGQRQPVRRLPGEEMVGRPISSVVAPDEFERFRARAARAFAGEETSFEGAAHGRALRGTISPLRDATGAIDMILSVAFDVTEEVEREARAVRDEKLRALGQMASGIAHDLNQALTLVSGYGELAREALSCDGPSPTPACEMIRIMERAAYDGGATVRRLLTFARGREHEHLQPVDVGVLLHEVEQLTAPRWRDASRADGHRVTLRVEAVPGLAIPGSQAELREMFTNLVFNALDAMPNGGSIVLSARPVDDHVLIDVADTGIGMSPEVKARAFEPFFTTKGQAGSGLGMAMVFGIIQRHQGQIDITTEEGRGTTIHLTFPVAERGGETVAQETDPEAVQACRILVVDDEPRLSALLVGLLRFDGHEGVTATSAEEALERLAAERFDLVISDLSMGEGMNGWDLAAAIAASPRPLPVLLATGWGAGIDEDEARQRGVSGVVPKPYRRADLHAAIVRVLADRQ